MTEDEILIKWALEMEQLKAEHRARLAKIASAHRFRMILVFACFIIPCLFAFVIGSTK